MFHQTTISLLLISFFYFFKSCIVIGFLHKGHELFFLAILKYKLNGIYVFDRMEAL